MKNIFSITIAILSITILTLFAGTFIDVSLQIQSAREYHNSVVQKIQASNYSGYVIDKCIEEGLLHEYGISIINTAIYSDKSDYYVSLEYPIRIVLFNNYTNGIIEGYAR